MQRSIVYAGQIAYLRRMSLTFCLALLVSPLSVIAQSAQLLDTPRFTLYFPSTPSGHETRGVDDLARNSLSILNSTYDELKDSLKVEPKAKVVLRFMNPHEFHEHTNAPSWTSAMFLRGEISIPITSSQKVNLKELTRAIRHEYTHAVVAELSAKGCPAWLDEGLAQLLEGETNPLLGPALREWIVENDSLPLTWLQNGFLSLNDQLVPVAYAQSLFATRLLIHESGYQAMSRYFRELAQGTSGPDAFQLAFGTTQKEFDRSLTRKIRVWAKSAAANP